MPELVIVTTWLCCSTYDPMSSMIIAPLSDLHRGESQCAFVFVFFSLKKKCKGLPWRSSLTLCFHYRGYGFDCWLENLDPTCHMAWPKLGGKRENQTWSLRYFPTQTPTICTVAYYSSSCLLKNFPPCPQCDCFVFHFFCFLDCKLMRCWDDREKLESPALMRTYLWLSNTASLMTR